MKTNFKFLNQLVVLVAVLGLLSPNLVYAQVGNISPGQGAGKSKSSFCAKISNSKIDQQIATKISNLQKNHQDRIAKITQQRSSRDAKIAANRASADTKRNQELTTLEEDAITPDQKAAVAKFVLAIKTAIATRRAAIDSAVRAFQTGVDKALATRRSALTTVLTNYYNAVRAALTVAKADCAEDANSSTARDKFVAASKAAKVKLQTEKAAIEKMNVSISGLVTVRKAAIAKAGDDFRAAFEAAKAELEKIENTEQ